MAGSRFRDYPLGFAKNGAEGKARQIPEVDPLATGRCRGRSGANYFESIAVNSDAVAESAERFAGRDAGELSGFGEFPEARHKRGIGRTLPEQKVSTILDPIESAVYFNCFLLLCFHGKLVLRASGAGEA